MPQADTQKKRPVHEIRIGAIKAVIWLNETEIGPRHNVQVYRLYTMGTGKKREWKQSDSFGRDDLLVVAKVADLAHTWIHQQLQHRDEDDE